MTDEFSSSTRSGWRIDGAAPTFGWVLAPDAETAVERDEWVAAQLDKVRAGSENPWPDGFEEYLSQVLLASFARRRDEDALLFQVWPTPMPICVWVHIAFGAVEPGEGSVQPGEALLYDGGPGLGVQIPFVDSYPEGDLLGMRYLFTGGGQALVVDVSPTTRDVLAALTPVLHGVLQAITVTNADGNLFTAEPPALPGAREEDTWAVSL